MLGTPPSSPRPRLGGTKAAGPARLLPGWQGCREAVSSKCGSRGLRPGVAGRGSGPGAVGGQPSLASDPNRGEDPKFLPLAVGAGESCPRGRGREVFPAGAQGLRSEAPLDPGPRG